MIPLMSFQSVWPTHKHPRPVNSCTFLVDIMDNLLTQDYQSVRYQIDQGFHDRGNCESHWIRMHGTIAQKFSIIYLPPIYTAVVWITKIWNGNEYSTALVDPSQIL